MSVDLRQDIGMALDRHFDSPADVDEKATKEILNEIMMVEKKWRK